jgi:hypothetical protein
MRLGIAAVIQAAQQGLKLNLANSFYSLRSRA